MADSDTVFSQQRDKFTTVPSECVSISQTNIGLYLYKSTKAHLGRLIDEIWSLNSEVWNVEFQFKIASEKPMNKIPINLS